MSGEPPPAITYGLDEALGLLAALEDARDVLLDGPYLGVLAAIESEIDALSRRLGFDDPFGGSTRPTTNRSVHPRLPAGSA